MILKGVEAEMQDVGENTGLLDHGDHFVELRQFPARFIPGIICLRGASVKQVFCDASIEDKQCLGIKPGVVGDVLLR